MNIVNLTVFKNPYNNALPQRRHYQQQQIHCILIIKRHYNNISALTAAIFTCSNFSR